MDPQILSQGSDFNTMAALLTLLVVVSATVWFYSRHGRGRRETSETQDYDREQPVFKVPQSPAPRTLRRVEKEEEEEEEEGGEQEEQGGKQEAQEEEQEEHREEQGEGEN